ncbi:MAG: hypothetical protein AB7P03_10955 [Kofleriaceae bacterium]
MIRPAWLSILLATTVSACAGEIPDSPGDDDTNDDGNNPPDQDPPDLSNDDPLCAAAFKVTGTFTPAAPLQPDVDDEWYEECWPAGTWTFTATIDNAAEVLDIDGDGTGDRCGNVAGTMPPTVASSYSVRIDREPDIDDAQTPDDPSDDAQLGWKDSFTMVGGADPANVITLKITGDGPTGCEGIFDVDDATHKQVWSFRPSLDGTSLEGTGEYTMFKGPQR